MAKAQPRRQGHWLMTKDGARYSQPFEWPDDIGYDRAYSQQALELLIARHGEHPATCHDVTDADEFDVGVQIDEYIPPAPKPGHSLASNGQPARSPGGVITLSDAAQILAQFTKDLDTLKRMAETLPQTIEAARVVSAAITDQFRPLLAVFATEVKQ